MATFTADNLSFPISFEAVKDTTTDSGFMKTSIESIDLTTSTTTYYVMRGRDTDCVGTVYRTWVVANTPDLTGALYTGTRCGITQFADIVVIRKYTA